jgi:hypothetical protein
MYGVKTYTDAVELVVERTGGTTDGDNPDQE